jgi:hypothetical protein
MSSALAWTCFKMAVSMFHIIAAFVVELSCSLTKFKSYDFVGAFLRVPCKYLHFLDRRSDLGKLSNDLMIARCHPSSRGLEGASARVELIGLLPGFIRLVKVDLRRILQNHGGLEVGLQALCR